MLPVLQRLGDAHVLIAIFIIFSSRASVKLYELGVRTPGGLFLGVRYGTPGCRFSEFSYAKPSHFRRNFRPTLNDKDVGLYTVCLKNC